MGLQIGEIIGTLIRLGLTLNQARTYLALVEIGPANAREIAKKADITRQDIYRVIPTLQETGIIEKTLNTPAFYIALPMQEGISILLKRKTAEQQELHKKTIEMLLDYKNNPKEEKAHENFESIIITSREAIIEKIKENLQKAQTSADVVTTKQRFNSTIPELAQLYHKALNRGVKIRIVTEQQTLTHPIQKILKTLKTPGFQLRYLDKEPEAVVSILDQKQVFVTLSATANFRNTSALLSNNNCFIALAQSYFEKKWTTAQQ